MSRYRDEADAPGERSPEWDTAFVQSRTGTAGPSEPRSSAPLASVEGPVPGSPGSPALDRDAVVGLPDAGARRIRYAGRTGDGALRFEPVAWTDAVASVTVDADRFRADVARGVARVEAPLSFRRRVAAEVAALAGRVRAALTPSEKGDVPHWLTR